MAKGDRDEAREERITMKIVVDAYSSDEVALTWYISTDYRNSPDKIFGG